MAGWQTAARNKRLGPKTELVTFEKPQEDGGGKYWIRPQKLSIEASSELRHLNAELASKVPPSVQRALKEASKRWQAENNTDAEPPFAELQALLSDDEWNAVSSSLEVLVNQADKIKLLLTHGIGEHNFDGEDGKILELNEALVDAWMEHEALAAEMVAIVEAWNRPLANGSEPSLQTASSGPSVEPPST